MADEEDPLSISWQNLAWFMHYKLEHQTVLTYFADSPFFQHDKEMASNAALRLQYNLQLMPFPSALYPFERVPGIVGEPYDARQMREQGNVLEYDVLPVAADSSDPVFVIVRQFREELTVVQAEAFFYVVRGVVYQAPDLASLLNARMLTVVCGLQNAFEEVQRYRRFHPSKGYDWQPIRESQNAEEDSKDKSTTSANRSHPNSKSASAEFSSHVTRNIQLAFSRVALNGQMIGQNAQAKEPISSRQNHEEPPPKQAALPEQQMKKQKL